MRLSERRLLLPGLFNLSLSSSMNRSRSLFESLIPFVLHTQAETDEKAYLEALKKVVVPEFVPDKSVKVDTAPDSAQIAA